MARNIVLISNIMPAIENVRGTSALPYHLMVARNKDVDVTIYSYNINELDDEQILTAERMLHVKIVEMEMPKWIVWTLRPYMLLVRLLLKYPVLHYLTINEKYLNEIEKSHFAGVWIYGEEMGRISKQLNKYKRVHTLPDAESLYYERLGGIRKIVSGNKFKRMENVMDRTVLYHLVGAADMEWFKKMAPGVDARFIRHPHYELVDKKIGFGKKVQLLVAGRNDIYMRRTANEMIEALQEILKTDEYVVTFLGKGWKDEVGRLRQVGYDVNWKEFVENYVAEVAKYDIQISPLSLGTGTKGKVLDAMANGVLVVGTKYALENIADGGVLYKSKEELKDVLLDILSDKEKYEEMASEARKNVRREHNRARVSGQLFDLFR